MPDFLDLFLRISLVLGVGLSVNFLCREISARVRSTILRATFLATLIVTGAWLSGWSVEVPVGPVQRVAPPVAEVSDLADRSYQSYRSYTNYKTYTPSSEAAAPVAKPMPIGVILWATGASLMMLMFGVTLLGVRRLQHTSAGIDSKTLVEAECAYLAAGIRRRVRTLAHTSIPTALTFGLFRPIVLVSDQLPDWQPEERRAGLAHEAAHIKRFDCAWQWAILALRAVLWFHPLTWILAWAHRETSELAADELAIQSGVSASDYAGALLSIAKYPNPLGPLSGRIVRSQGAMNMNLSTQPLSRRIRAALRPQRGFSTLTSLAVAATIAAFGFLAGTGRIVPAALIQEAPVTPPVVTSSVQAAPAAPATPVAPKAPAAAATPKAIAKKSTRKHTDGKIVQKNGVIRQMTPAERAEFGKAMIEVERIGPKIEAEMKRAMAEISRSKGQMFDAKRMEADIKKAQADAKMTPKQWDEVRSALNSAHREMANARIQMAKEMASQDIAHKEFAEMGLQVAEQALAATAKGFESPEAMISAKDIAATVESAQRAGLESLRALQLQQRAVAKSGDANESKRLARQVESLQRQVESLKRQIANQNRRRPMTAQPPLAPRPPKPPLAPKGRPSTVPPLAPLAPVAPKAPAKG